MHITENALLVRDGVLSRVTIDVRDGSAHEDIRTLIGSGFSTCFVVPGYGGRQLRGWCDDEYLMRKPAPTWNVLLHPAIYHYQSPGYPIGGPIVITAGEGPETVSMIELEMSAFYLSARRKYSLNGALVIEVPTLFFRPGFDT